MKSKDLAIICGIILGIAMYQLWPYGYETPAKVDEPWELQITSSDTDNRTMYYFSSNDSSLSFNDKEGNLYQVQGVGNVTVSGGRWDIK